MFRLEIESLSFEAGIVPRSGNKCVSTCNDCLNKSQFIAGKRKWSNFALIPVQCRAIEYVVC